MGDRTYATLTVLSAHAERVKEIMEGQGGPDDEDDDGFFLTLSYSEVNYGKFDEQGQLQAEGIAYDTHWDSGGDYGPGNEYCRFTADGKIEVKQVSDESVNPDLATLLDLLDDHAALVAAIRQHADAITALPFDARQIQNGRLYNLTRRLKG